MFLHLSDSVHGEGGMHGRSVCMGAYMVGGMRAGGTATEAGDTHPTIFTCNNNNFSCLPLYQCDHFTTQRHW